VIFPGSSTIAIAFILFYGTHGEIKLSFFYYLDRRVIDNLFFSLILLKAIYMSKEIIFTSFISLVENILLNYKMLLNLFTNFLVRSLSRSLFPPQDIKLQSKCWVLLITKDGSVKLQVRYVSKYIFLHFS